MAEKPHPEQRPRPERTATVKPRPHTSSPTWSLPDMGLSSNAPTSSLIRPSAHRRRILFLSIAFLFHLIYAYSIFDIYFVSPVVSGMGHVSVPGPAPAKRLVLFVGDGLRADKAFQSFPDPSPDANDTDAHVPRPLMPFLRSRIEHHGTFGVSHTRVPTESRPGHIALIAGLYEDVSAVMTGWKHNPVNFDSLFNRSSHTWSWGSPDILPMFKDGAVPGRIDAFSYGAEAEDFTTDSTELDTWVFDRVKKLFVHDAPADPVLDRELRQDRVVFFLHLLGLDTAGHSYRPYSKEYLHNIKVVDAGVRETVELVNRFYGDNDTAFVFTADHGMSDWGSHGDGHPDNTRTPLIAWGAGVAAPKKNEPGVKAAGHNDGFSHDWSLDHVQRNDVEQADVAALMAYLIGAAFPANSVGQLPVAYLNADDHQKAVARLANAKQVLEMYRVKEDQKRRSKVWFVPYPALTKYGQPSSTLSTSMSAWLSAQERVDMIDRLIKNHRYQRAWLETMLLFHTTLEGLRYLQTYDWLFLRTLATLGYVGWIVYALLTVVDMHAVAVESVSPSSSPSSNGEQAKVQAKATGIITTDTAVAASLTAGLFAFLAAQHSPWTYYAYAAFPIFFWHQAFALRGLCATGVAAVFGLVPPIRRLARAILYLTFVEALVYSYFDRRVYTLMYLLAAVWPFFSFSSSSGSAKSITDRPLLAIRWVGSCAVMAVFTLLPAMKVESLPLVLSAGALMLIIACVYLRSQTRRRARSMLEQARRNLLGFRIGLIGLAMATTWSSVRSLQAKQGLPLGAQVVGWATLVGSIVVCPIIKTILARSSPSPPPPSTDPAGEFDGLSRLMDLFITFAPAFVILTISYEGFFYIAFFSLLSAWVDLERFQSPAPPLVPTTSPAHPPNPVDPAPLLEPVEVPNPKLISKSDKLSPPDHDQPGSPQSEKTVQCDPDESITTTTTTPTRPITPNEFRISLLLLFLIQSAFFSTGNLASVSSFSLDAVYRLIPVFDPFSQGALLIVKLMIPFAALSGAARLVNTHIGVAESAIFMTVVALADVLTLHFFWLVRDEGSWLDIGTTISRFIIAELLGLFVVGLEAISGFVV